MNSGRPIPGFTINSDGSVVLDQLIVEALEYRSEKEFANGGGYQKFSQLNVVPIFSDNNHSECGFEVDENDSFTIQIIIEGAMYLYLPDNDEYFMRVK